MLGSDVLDVAIGLAFLFFIASLAITAAREWIEGMLQMRAVHLERGVREILRDKDGKGAASWVYAHPQVSALFRGDYDPGRQLAAGWFDGKIERLLGKWTPRWLFPKDEWQKLTARSNLPAYIPTRNFAMAILDLAARGPASVAPVAADTGPGAAIDLGPVTFASVREGAIENFKGNPYLQRLVLNSLDTAKGDLDVARTNLEKVFDSAMDRVSGWYRKETQTILFWLGLVVAVGLNIDTIHVASELYRNGALRAVVVAEAQGTADRVNRAAVATTPAATPTTPVPAPADPDFRRALACTGDAKAVETCIHTRLQGFGYPVGWKRAQIEWGSPIGLTVPVGVDFKGEAGWASVPGWILTALALMLGAPFWFDVLNKLIVIRSTVKPHEKSPEESSEDRQTRQPPAATTQPGTTTPGSTTVGNDPPTGDPDFVPLKWAGADDDQEGDL